VFRAAAGAQQKKHSHTGHPGAAHRSRIRRTYTIRTQSALSLSRSTHYSQTDESHQSHTDTRTKHPPKVVTWALFAASLRPCKRTPPPTHHIAYSTMERRTRSASQIPDPHTHAGASLDIKEPVANAGTIVAFEHLDRDGSALMLPMRPVAHRQLLHRSS
jgi:hypothetical protein